MAQQNAPAGDVYRMPYEGNETSVTAASESLFEALGSDPDFADEEQPTENEPVTEESEEEEDSEVESDEPEEDEGEEDEEDEEDEDSEDADEAPDPQAKIKVKVDGEEIEVTLEELTKGYSRTSDYTRKTQALAEQRKQIETEAQQIRDVQQRYAQGLTELEQALAQMKPAEPDWDKLRRENPAEFAARWADHQRFVQDQQAVAQERQRVQAELSERQQRELNQVLEVEKKALVEAIPEWSNPEVASEEKKQLAQYAQSLGFTEEQLAQVYDHRIMVMLRKAQRFDQIQAKGKTKIQSKVKDPKVLKPGARDQTPPKQKGKRKQARTAMDRLARTGRPQDAAAALMAILPEDI